MAAKRKKAPSLTQNQHFKLVENALLTRDALVNQMSGGRDINDECHYPDVITLCDYRQQYDRGLGSRVVSLMPDESWQTRPTIVENEDDETKFEMEFKALEKQHKLWSYLERIDELSGIGTFGVLLLGFSDGKELSEEVQGKQKKLTYIRPFAENSVTIKTIDEDEKSERFSLPTQYEIEFMNTESLGTSIQSAKKKLVHWTRIIHVADNRKESEIYGTPRMRSVFNNLLDLTKILGASAEGVWKGGYPGLAFDLDPQVSFSDAAKADMKTQIEEFDLSLRKYLTLQGVSVKAIDVKIVDPTPQFEIQLKTLCSILKCPWRKFVGTETAKLAGDADTRAWNDQVAKRRESYLTPFLIREVIGRLQEFGILSEADYEVVWDDLNTVTDMEKAKVATERTKALALYTSSGLDTLIPPMEYFVDVHGFSEELAMSLVKAALDAMGDDDAAELSDAMAQARTPKLGDGEEDDEEQDDEDDSTE